MKGQHFGYRVDEDLRMKKTLNEMQREILMSMDDENEPSLKFSLYR